MPLAFLLIGAILVIVAVRGTHAQLGALLTQDFTGSGGADHGFLVWIAAIGGIAAIGMIPDMKTPARLLLALVILAILVSNKGVFAQAAKALGGTIPGVTLTSASASPTDQPLPAAIPVQVSTSASGGGAAGATAAVGTATQVVSAVSNIIPFLA